MAIKKDNKRILVTLSKTMHDKIKFDAEFECRSISKQAAYIINTYYREKEKQK